MMNRNYLYSQHCKSIERFVYNKYWLLEIFRNSPEHTESTGMAKTYRGTYRRMKIPWFTGAPVLPRTPIKYAPFLFH